MTKFTEKQQLFIDGKAAGMTNQAAAEGAGYALSSADVAAAKLLRRPEVKSAIAKARRALHKSGVAPTKPASKGKIGVEEIVDEEGRVMQRDHYADPMHFLEDLINLNKAPLAMRAKAATDLMPYRHARIGEKGKKENKHDAAKEIHGGKFKPQKSPTLATVTSIHGR